MPEKIPFSVVFCSGADDGHPATDLEVHSPLVNGWQTPRYCTWPQQVVLELKSVARVRKVQILSHEYKIASKLEIHVATLPRQFRRLGHVSLSTNQDNKFQSRELKSIHIDAVAKFIRLVVHKNHLNAHNWYNQAGIVAVNIIGDADHSLDSTYGGHGSASSAVELNVGRLTGGHSASLEHRDIGGGAYDSSTSAVPWVSRAGGANMAMASGRIDYIGYGGGGNAFSNAHGAAESALDLGLINKLEHVDPEHDLKFDMYTDPEIAAVVRQLLHTKRECIRQEDYRGAKEIKASIAGLLEAGSELAKLGVLKQRAVESEDYDTAEMIRKQVDIFRRKVYQAYGVSRTGEILLDTTAHRDGDRAGGMRTRYGSERSAAGELPPVVRHSPRSGSRGDGLSSVAHSSVPSAIPRTPPLPEIGSVSGRSSSSQSHRGTVSPRTQRKEPTVYLDDHPDGGTLTRGEGRGERDRLPPLGSTQWMRRPGSGGSDPSEPSRPSRDVAHAAVGAGLQGASRSSVAARGGPGHELTRTIPAQDALSGLARGTAPGPRVVYTIEVTTGGDRKAGTDAAVFVELVGDGGVTSGAIPLVGSKTNTVAFQRGKTDVFDTAPISSLGNLASIRVVSDGRHGPRNKHSDWHIKSLRVESNDGGVWVFPCDEWLSKKTGLAREFPAAVFGGSHTSSTHGGDDDDNIGGEGYDSRSTQSSSRVDGHAKGTRGDFTVVAADGGGGGVGGADGTNGVPGGFAPAGSPTSPVGVPVERLVVNTAKSLPFGDGPGGGFPLVREKSIPVGKKSKGGGFEGGPSGAPPKPGDPDEISQARRDKASDAITLYGEHTVRCVFSRGFKHKVEGLEAVTSALLGKTSHSGGGLDGHSAGEVCRGTAQLLAAASDDGVTQVAERVVACVQALMTRCGSDASAEDVRVVVAAVLPGLLNKSGGVGAKSKFAINAVGELFTIAPIRKSPEGYQQVLRKIPTKMGFKEVAGRCLVVESLIKSIGVSSVEHFTADDIFEFLLPNLTHKNADVRTASCSAATALFSLLSPDQRAQLRHRVPQDSHAYTALA